MIQITEKYLNALSRKFNIVADINTLNYDYDYTVLTDLLSNFQTKEFNLDDRILIEFFDTAYYDSKFLKHSILLQNTFSIFKHLDIPLFTILIITNHFGIKSEIDNILSDHDEHDRPTIVETFINNFSYNPKKVINLDISINKISHSALAMMNDPRSHRVALYHYLEQNNLLGNVDVSLGISKDRK